jgi:hypothetical protein
MSNMQMLLKLRKCHQNLALGLLNEWLVEEALHPDFGG